MAGPVTTVNLNRPSPHMSWGFRLQGGTDFRQELSVKKVEPNSPAHGQLNQGDAILSIGGYDARQMTHAQASQMIKNSTTSLQLTLQKGQFRSIKPTGPIKFSAGVAAGFSRPGY